LGLGSTTLLAETILKTNVKKPNFVTIEVDYVLFKKAKKNLAKYDFVTPTWGLTVLAATAIEFIKKDEAITNHSQYADVFIDNLENPTQFYLDEVNGQLSKQYFKKSNFLSFVKKLFDKAPPNFQENLFATLLPVVKNDKPLILLDSAGGIGFLEFQTVHNALNGTPYFLILDDIHHLKHFRSYKEVTTNPNFKILAQNKEHGWVIAKHL
jgi:hypothetical protein